MDKYVPVCTIMAIVDADGRAVRPASSYIESAQYGTRKGVEKTGKFWGNSDFMHP